MNRLRNLREDRDLRQTDVALATGINQQTLSNYETGKTKIDSDSLIKLADYYKVSVDYLLGRNSVNIDIEKELERIESDIDTLRKKIRQN